MLAICCERRIKSTGQSTRRPRVYCTIYRSLGNFRGKKFSCDNFSRVKFSFSGPSTKMYHRENLSCTKTRWTSTEELCVFVAIRFIVKSGRQLLDKLALKNNELLAATPFNMAGIPA